MIDNDQQSGDSADRFRFISTACPACGSRLRPVATATSNVYLACEACGIAAI